MVKYLARLFNYFLGGILSRNKIHISTSLEYLSRQREVNKNYFDYIRLSTLELMSFEINKKKLVGNVAELGVYKGKFAQYINLYFPDRSLYLFDTFDGFDARDIISDLKNSYSSGNQNFSDTSIENVLEIMKYPNKCIPVKGFFPDSACFIDDNFVFVSIDADLYDPIYAGLEFFYPKLVSGGYILIHDFNNENYLGVRKAVEFFCAERRIGYTVIPDSAGSAVITK